MSIRRAAILACLSSAACAASSPPPPPPSCDALVNHAALLRVESRLASLPEAEREAHRDGLTRAVEPALRAACDRMAASERMCWRDATSADELSRCAQPTADDAATLARTGRFLADDVATPSRSPNLYLRREEP